MTFFVPGADAGEGEQREEGRQRGSGGEHAALTAGTCNQTP